MAFATPWLLLAAAAVAVPIAVHLVAREPRGGTAFPSLMFLSRIPVRERRRRTLRDRALLAARCLAIALLALAFAGPYALEPETTPAASGRAVAVLVDRSASMGHGGRWAAAREAARVALERVGPTDEAALVLFDTRHAVVTGDAAVLGAAIAAARPGDGATDIAGAIEAGARWLASAEAVRRELVLVSDLQRTGLEAGRTIRVDPEIAVGLVPVGDDAPNASLVHARARPARAGRMQVEASVRHDAGATRPSVTLHLDGQMTERQEASGRGSELSRVSFEIAAPVSRAAVVRLALDPDALVADDERHLVLAPVRPVRVLVVGAGPRPGPSGAFVRRALEVATDPPAEVRYRDGTALDATALEEVDVVVLDDVPVAGAWLPALGARVAAGSGLLVFAGEGVRGAWPGGTDGIVPGVLGATRAPSELPARLAPGREVPAGLEAGAVWRHRVLERGSGDRVLVALRDGTPIALERAAGAGRSAAVATTLDAGWSTLAREPGFVPLVHDLVARLAGRHRDQAEQAHPVGSVVNLAEHARAIDPAAAARLDAGAEAVVRGPDGRETRLVAGAPLALQEAGVHEVHVGPQVFRVAANVPARESDLAALGAGELDARIVRAASTGAAPRGERAPTPEDGERWWWRILLAAMILMLVESWHANRLSLRARA